MKKLVIAVTMIIIICPHFALAQPQIFTTLRGGTDSIVWDGKWSYLQEWKPMTENILRFNDGNELSVKTGHDRENLYVFLDFISEEQFKKKSDYGVVCIAANKTMESDVQKDDYCFLVALGSYNPLTFQGGGDLVATNHFVKIQNDPGLIAVGGVSDEHDRYSGTPHPSYEFKIPIKVIGSSDMYSFYVATYDAQTDKVYSWPQNITNNEFPAIPSPSEWGELISPDKSLPEFPWPLFMMIFAFSLTIFVTRRQSLSKDKLV
ncbi:MAG: hypothetical protein KGI02_10495 [Thaumarchaeota archaeon]|nr:hypothetical protein [Nitrososphaerota archaeon]MDE1832777.1 hypothetical protein [Nitrososphaerota archaeon]MDE1878884.1 hypothetical protein [Nitrososphaerota archaeon]